jgi:hypothetical protein
MNRNALIISASVALVTWVALLWLRNRKMEKWKIRPGQWNKIADAIAETLDEFGASGEAYDNANKIMRSFERYGDGDMRKLAYILATAWHESWLKPIKEIRASSSRNPDIRRRQDRYWHTGYFGRGFVQLTWEENYRKLGDFVGLNLVDDPDQALIPHVAADILVVGMLQGLFTGKKLSNYIHAYGADYYNARRVVNATDRANTIAGYTQRFMENFQPRKQFA